MSLTKTHFKTIASILADVKDEIHPQVYEDLVERFFTHRAFNGFRKASAIFLRAATQQATTATSGPKFCRPMLTRPSRKTLKTTRWWGNVSGKRFSPRVDHAQPLSHLKPFGDVSQAQRLCFGTLACLKRHSTKRGLSFVKACQLECEFPKGTA